eukprot:TRINITY_DN8311_c2_g1_i5.p1 TRINITY_DN8311_c2_g1~~TRINITY_DN8311_c2_g1_i5.p1  ORF type:complete len:192 (-),score=17.26 TRINITY_DN8311_c2_g1_i5:1438-2013(-)
MLFTLVLSCSLFSVDMFTMIIRALFLLFLGNSQSQGESPAISEKQSLIFGKYSLGSTENFDAYLAELGVNFILRNLAKLAKPTINISRNCEGAMLEDFPIDSHNCTWKIYTETPFKTHTIRFRLDQQVDDYTMDGRSTKSIFNVRDDQTLVEYQMGSVNTTLVREFDSQRMKVTLRVNDVVATSIFPRVES